ncbi:ion channel [Paenibacillus pinihumi]|uniref:ion channel n=1 Tax=Paenibacillus pinihumi TaxID=669462 RepID=UPI001FE16334|nr:ion channel [Paenibacillus pinihumi]
MKVKTNIMLLVIVLLSSFLFTLKGYAENHENRVVVESNVSSIIDLETLEVENSTIVKLYGVSIDYYRKYLQDYKEEELSQTETGLTVGVSKAYFKGESVDHLINRAQEFYESLLLGKRVYLEKIPGDTSYIVYLDRERKQSLNQLAVKYGMVVVSEKYHELPDLLIQQEEARNLKAGLWDIIVYRKDNGGWGESNFAQVSFGLLVINFILSVIIYIYYLKERSLLGVIAVYVTWLTTIFFTTGIYVFNERQLFFWAPPTIVIIFSLLGVTEFILFIHSNSKRSLIYITVKMTLFVILVVVGFGILYQGYSNAARKQTEVAYSLPYFESNNERYEDPQGNYIAIPVNEYQTLNLGEVKFADRVKNKYKYYLSLKNALYYSAVTFFTVGYGDFSPKGILKIVSVIQMLIGYLSQVILFSLVVSKIASYGVTTPVANEHLINEQRTVFTSRKIRFKRKKILSKYVVYVIFIIVILENLYIWSKVLFPIIN